MDEGEQFIDRVRVAVYDEVVDVAVAVIVDVEVDKRKSRASL